MFWISVHCRHKVVNATQLDVITANRIHHDLYQTFVFVIRNSRIVEDVCFVVIPLVDSLNRVFRQEIFFIAKFVSDGLNVVRASNLQINPVLKVVVWQLAGIDKHSIVLIDCIRNQL